MRRRSRSLRAAVMAVLYAGTLALGFNGVAGALLPAPALAASDTITSCTSAGLSAAVSVGGTWTFACHGTIVVDSALNVTQPLTLVVPTTQTVTLQQGAGGNDIFFLPPVHGPNGASLTLTGNGQLTLEGGLAAPTGLNVLPLVNNDSGGSVTIDGTTVTDTVVGATYAPIYNMLGSVLIKDSTFTHNHGDSGGAVYNGEGGSMTVVGTVFSHNHADFNANLTLNSSYPDVDAGGAIHNAGGGSLTVADSTFTDNSAVASLGASNGPVTGEGGAIYSNGQATISGSTFTGNQAEGTAATVRAGGPAVAVGGAIASLSPLVLSNSTLTENTAYQGGGGLADVVVFGPPPPTTVQNSTFAANQTLSGGDNFDITAPIMGGPGPGVAPGIPSTLPLMQNDIMYDPRASTASYQDCFPVLPTPVPGTAGNLEQGDGSCSANGTLPGWTQGNADLQGLAANPGAYPDASHPLLTETMALGPGSKAIGLGDSAVCQGANVGGVDERGMARPAGACDAGAYQSLGITLSATGPVTIQGGSFDTATVSGTVYSDVYSLDDLASMPVALSTPAGDGSLSPASTSTNGSGDFGGTYTAPASVPATAAEFTPVTVTATTYGEPATATVDVLTPPDLTSLSASSGTAGSTLTLSGFHFEDTGTTAGYVSFTPTGGGTAVHAPPTAASDTSATVTVPSTFAAGTTLEIAIQNPAQGLLSNALPYTVTSPTGGGSPPPSTGGGIPVSQQVPTANTCGAITLPAGSSLQAGAGSASTPTGLAPDARVASCVFALTGPALSQPEPVAVQYNPDALNGLPPTRISLFRLRSDGAWTFLPSAVDAATETVTAYASGPATVVALADVQVFPDVSASYWAYGPINVAAAGELVDGFPPPYAGPYEPDGPLTRAQAAKMVVVDAQLLPQAGSTPFTDVQAGDWFAPYVAAGYQAGILQGMTATSFGPGASVTREQFAVMLARALKLKGTAALTFADAASIAPWALPAVEATVAAGYFQGMPGNLFEPEATLTRAQAAQVMARVIAGQAPTANP